MVTCFSGNIKVKDRTINNLLNIQTPSKATIPPCMHSVILYYIALLGPWNQITTLTRLPYEMRNIHAGYFIFL